MFSPVGFMMQQVNQARNTVIKDADGKVVDQKLPLSPAAYASITRCCMSRRSIYALDDQERDRIFQRASELRLAHERMRELRAEASTGNDLNNFWVLFESIPYWSGEEACPSEKWQLERGDGFSEKYLAEPLKTFAKNIGSAYEALGIKPSRLKAAIQKAAADGQEDAPAWGQLRKVYLHLRSLGYADRELTQ